MRVKFVLGSFGLIAVLLFGLLARGVAQEVPPVRSLPMPEARVNGGPELAQGNVWMHWSADHQLGYVQGWMDGGYCGTSMRVLRPG